MLKWSKKDAVEALFAFYRTVEPAADENEKKEKKWRGVYIDGKMAYAFYGERELAHAVAVFMANTSVADRYLSNAVESRIADCLIEHKIMNRGDPREAIIGLVGAIVDTAPEELLVYMPVYGVDVPSGDTYSVGNFLFVPHDGYDALHIKSLPIADIKNRMWGDAPHVAVTVRANDTNMAREKALREFQWLENVVRLFVDSDFYDFGITSYNFSRVENALVTTKDGHMRGASSHLRGSPHLLSFRHVFDPQKILYKVVCVIGRRSEDLTPYQCRIRHAVYLGGLSAHETSLPISYFLGVSALEALFQTDTDKYVSPSIAQQIVETFCYLVSDDDKRRQTFEDMRSFYKRRSIVAHGGVTDLSREDVVHVRAYLRAAVSKLLFDPQLSQIHTPQDLAEHIKNVKFGKKDGGV